MYKVFISIFFFSAIGFGQDRIDSLKQNLKKAHFSDSLLCDSYVSILRFYRNENADSCKVYFDRFFNYANKEKSNTAFYQYHRLKADYFGLFNESKGNTYSFINTNLLEALEYAKKIDDSKQIFKIYSRLTQENARFGKEEEALQYAKEAEAISLTYNLPEETAYIYGQIGKIYNLGFGKTDMALEYLLKSDSIYNTYHFEGYQQGFTLTFIGDVYESFEDYEEAKAYNESALEVFKKAENKYQQNFIYGKLGIIESKQGNFKKAIEYIQNALSYYKTYDYPIQESVFLLLLSDIYLKNGQIETALQKGQEAILVSNAHGDTYGLMKAYLNQAKIFQQKKDYIHSNLFALKAEPLAKEMEFYEELEEIYELLFLNSENIGDYREAYHYSNEHRRVNDTLAARENLQKAKEREAKYQTEKKKQEIALLTAQKELISKQKENQKILLLGGLGVTTLAGTFFFFLYRNRQKTHRKLKELDTAKSNFFTNISHEFRTPLTLISAPIEKRLEDGNLSKEDRHDFELVERNSKRLLHLVDQLLDLAKLESGNLTLKIKEGDLSAHLKSIAASFEHKATIQNLKYEVSILDSLKGYYDTDALEKITINLLSNAFKYVTPPGCIRFFAAVENKQLLLQVENDGEISGSTSLEDVFNRFYQKDENREGVGVGLALVKELVSLHQGIINVANTPKKTVLFEVLLPISKESFTESEIVGTTETAAKVFATKVEEVIIPKTEGEAVIDENAAVLLIVEDNDDIRNFIQSAFTSQFQVITASDGEEGIKKALETVPDIIISDIMMPRVSGLELCKILKNDERTSHVPIVLLTAKAEEETQYKGLDTGADDYIVKPFKIKFLETRVQNLVTSRKQLRERYSQEVVLKPKNIAISRIDEKFIEKVQTVLDQYLTKPDFTVEDFSDQMGMSRMQLHRKLKALTGVTASELIRNERLKLAASMLKESDVHVSEICYQAGFNNPSYFAKCFKEVYGCLPSEYSQQ
ncbi:MAG: response regulator [Flavobacteriaceae bacterium]